MTMPSLVNVGYRRHVSINSDEKTNCVKIRVKLAKTRFHEIFGFDKIPVDSVDHLNGLVKWS